MSHTINIVSVDAGKASATLFCNAESGQNYMCLIQKRLLGFAKQPCWAIYMGISQTEYTALLKSPSAIQDRYSFLGIAGGNVMIQQGVIDLLLLDRPQHFVGVHYWGSQLENIETPKLIGLTMNLVAQVLSDLAQVGAL